MTGVLEDETGVRDVDVGVEHDHSGNLLLVLIDSRDKEPLYNLYLGPEEMAEMLKIIADKIAPLLSEKKAKDMKQKLEMKRAYEDDDQ